MGFQQKFVLVLVAIAMFCISYSVVLAKPNAETVQDLELFEVEVKRTKRQAEGIGGTVGGAVAGAGVNWIAQSIQNSFECSQQTGCHKGYCWNWCGVSLTGGEWCYSTKSHSQSFQYVKCTQDSDCDKCWKCAGSCTL